MADEQERATEFPRAHRRPMTTFGEGIGADHAGVDGAPVMLDAAPR